VAVLVQQQAVSEKLLSGCQCQAGNAGQMSVHISFDITHIFHEAMLHFMCTMKFARHPQIDSFDQKFVIDKKNKH
jgi:hypothetical protein